MRNVQPNRRTSGPPSPGLRAVCRTWLRFLTPSRDLFMKGVLFIIGVVLCLLIFGPPIFGCFLLLLAVGLDVAVETAFPCAAFLTVAWIVGIGIKKFFLDD
jgi:hypothetical protein